MCACVYVSSWRRACWVHSRRGALCYVWGALGLGPYGFGVVAGSSRPVELNSPGASARRVQAGWGLVCGFYCVCVLSRPFVAPCGTALPRSVLRASSAFACACHLTYQLVSVCLFTLRVHMCVCLGGGCLLRRLILRARAFCIPSKDRASPILCRVCLLVSMCACPPAAQPVLCQHTLNLLRAVSASRTALLCALWSRWSPQHTCSATIPHHNTPTKVKCVHHHP